MEISTPAELLFAALEKAAKDRARIEIDAVRTAFLDVFPEWQGQMDRRERLWTLLDELARVNRLRLPKNKRHGWELLPAPPLPKWIVFVHEQAPARQTFFDHHSFPWVQELAFVARLKVLLNADEVRQIHEFLKNQGQKRPIVPVKERSLQIFGDEKRLDALRKTKLFASDRLTLELLRCRDVPASLPCIPGPQPSRHAWLIVENEATFHTFARLNRLLALHTGIVFGSGRTIFRAIDFLLSLLASQSVDIGSEFLYFGDLDKDGIEIPLELDRRLCRRANIRVRAAERYYEWLLDGMKESCSSAAADWKGLEWFPDHLRPRIAATLERNRPLAQEAVGREFLASQFQISEEVPF